jgi:hypothetical protein
VASFVFYQLYTYRRVVRSEVRCRLEEVLGEKDASETVGVLHQLVEDMQYEEKVPVSKRANRHLTDLAARLQGEISNLNKFVVTKVVE